MLESKEIYETPNLRKGVIIDEKEFASNEYY